MLGEQAGGRLAFYSVAVADERIGELILRKRKGAGWSQAVLSARLINSGLNFDQTAVSNVELGKRELDMSELAAFGRVLDISEGEMAKAILAEYVTAYRDRVPGSIKDARAVMQMRETMRKKHSKK